MVHRFKRKAFDSSTLLKKDEMVTLGYNARRWFFCYILSLAMLLLCLFPQSSLAQNTDSPDIYGKSIPFGDYVHPPNKRLVLNNLIAGRANPTGLVNITRLGVQKVLYRRESALLRNNFAYAGLQLKLIPTAIKAGIVMEIAPISVFRVRASMEWMHYFNTFNSFESFASPTDDYSDSAQSSRTSDGLSYSTNGLRAAIEPLLQFRVPIGKKNADGAPLFYIALRNKICMAYNRMSTRDSTGLEGSDDTVWYNSSLDTLLPAKGWTLQNKLDVLLMTRIRLTIGVGYTVVRPIYKDSDFRTVAQANAYDNDNGHQRIGPIIAYTFFNRAYTRFNRPTVLFIANWYLKHKWRRGKETSAALPYMLLAFAFQSDFWNGLSKH